MTYLAGAVATGGDRVLFWTVGAAVWKSRYSGGSWGSPAAWTNSVDSISGVACKYRLDWNVVICGAAQTSQDAKVWTALYGDGSVQAADTWSGLTEVTTATATSGVSFRSPAVEFLQHWRLFFVEKYTGSLAYSRLQWSTMNGTADFNQELWREPIPFDYTGDYGVAVTGRNLGGALWLSAPAGVWSGLAPTFPNLDVSADVLEATVQLDEEDGRVRIVLRNPATSGQALLYSGYGSGALAVLQRGARLQLAPGYHTSAGAEASTGPAYWVESIEQVTGASPRLVVHARDGWWLLSQWRARRQFLWAAGTKTVSQILQFVCARAGLDFASVSSSAALTTLKPAFTIHPDEDGKTAVRRLLAMVPDVAILRGGTLTIVHPQANDTPVYDYALLGSGASTDHAIVNARYSEAGAGLNRVRVLGAGVFDERFDFAEIEAVGERIGQVLDLNLTTTAQAGDRAAAGLRDAKLESRRDELQVFGVNCGQELYDVVSVTDPQVAFTDAPRRVLGLTWRYKGEGGRYDMTLSLGNP